MAHVKTNPDLVRVGICNLLGCCTSDNIRNGYLEGVAPGEAYARGITTAIIAMLVDFYGWEFPEAISAVKTLANHVGVSGNMGFVPLDSITEAWRDPWERAEMSDPQF